MILRSISFSLLFATLLCGVLAAAGSETPASPIVKDTLRDSTTFRSLSGKKLERGRRIYNAQCRLCHELGANGAPRIGHDTDWVSRVVKGRRTLLTNTITGLGSMPPRGGGGSLSDRELGYAVDYMLAALNRKQGGAP